MLTHYDEEGSEHHDDYEVKAIETTAQDRKIKAGRK
jgi:hypothetical protein